MELKIKNEKKFVCRPKNVCLCLFLRLCEERQTQTNVDIYSASYRFHFVFFSQKATLKSVQKEVAGVCHQINSRKFSLKVG